GGRMLRTPRGDFHAWPDCDLAGAARRGAGVGGSLGGEVATLRPAHDASGGDGTGGESEPGAAAAPARAGRQPVRGAPRNPRARIAPQLTRAHPPGVARGAAPPHTGVRGVEVPPPAARRTVRVRGR